MNIDYVSGFFDADGSITMAKNHSKCPYRALKIDFTNTKLDVLVDIQNFLKNEYGLVLCISTKPSKKENHSESYVLSSSSNRVVLKLCSLMTSYHPIKRHRINTVLKYHNLVVRRNGKYNDREKLRRLAYERLFFSTIFQ